MQKAIPSFYGLRLYLLVVLRVRRTTCAPLRAVAPLRSATALFPVALSIPDLTRTARRGHGDRETNGGHRHIGPCDPRARNDSYLRATCANRAEVWLTDSECHAHTWTSPFTAEREDRCTAKSRRWMCVLPRSTQAGPAPAGPSSALSKCHSELVDYSGLPTRTPPRQRRLDLMPQVGECYSYQRIHITAARQRRASRARSVAAVANEQWSIDGEEASYSVCNSSPGSSR
jgi:hypothetical protein